MGIRQFQVCFLLIGFVSAICFLFSAYIGSEVVAFILLVTLSVIAMFFDILPVLLSALLSALIWDFFFLQPRFNFRVGTTEDKIMLSMYFVIALLNAVLTYKIRQVEKVARQKEEKANKLKLYHTMFDSLSHEFRTPLATIIGASDNLLNEPPGLSGNDRERLLAEISIASLRLNQQVENLLNISRLESGVIEPKKTWCDIKELLYDVTNRLDEQLKKYFISIHVKDHLPLFKLDYGLMEQVIYNLVYNAIRHTPEGTSISVHVEYKEEMLRIMVEDNGQGFPEAEMEMVFEKFYRLKDTRGAGTGLGLSIVKGFVEAHEGTIRLSNGEQQGSRFTIDIPASTSYLNISKDE